MRSLIAALVAVAACGGGKDPAVCRREAAALGELLSTMDHEAPSFYARDVTLVTRTDVRPATIARGLTLAISKRGLELDGQLLEGAPAVEQLAAAQERADAFSGGKRQGPALVYLVIDEEAPWQDVARALRLVHEAGFAPALAFTRPPSPVTRPPRSRIDDELDRIQHSDDVANKATELARLLEKEVKGCPALLEAFGSVAADTGESKAETVIRAIEPSLVKCNCNLDLPSFRSAMFRVLYIEKPQSSFRFTLDPAATPITLPPSTPWRIAHDRFAPEARVWVNAP